MSGVKFGLGTWSYTDPDGPGFEAVAARVSEAGYDGIELDGSAEWFTAARYPTSADRRRLSRYVRGFGLEACAFNPAHYEYDIATDDPEFRSAYLADIGRAVELASDCEIPIVRLDTAQAPPGPVGVSAEERVARVSSVWAEAAETAERNGVRLAWEFEPGFMCNSPQEVLSIVTSIESPGFGVLFDTCHAHMVAEVGARQEEPVQTLPGGSPDLARQLADRIALVHVIDSDGTIHDGFTSTHVPIGDGVLDLPTVLSACRESGYTGPWFTVDLCFWPRPGEHEAACRTRLQDLLRQVGAQVAT